MSYEKPSEEENGGVYTQADVLSLAEPVFHALAWPTTLLSESRCSPALVLPKEGLMYDPSCRKAMGKGVSHIA